MLLRLHGSHSKDTEVGEFLKALAQLSDFESIFPLRLIVTGDFIFSSSYDKTARAWHFDTQDIGENMEDEACIRTFQGHTKGVYPIIFIPAEDFDPNDGAVINPGDMLITGSADHTARSWSFDTGGCLKVE